MLIGTKGATPRSVQLEIGESALFLDRPGHELEELSLRSLVRRGEDRGVLRFGRRGRPGWELRVSGTAAREVMAAMPGPRARLGRLASTGWHMWPVAAALVALAVAQIPANWADALTPASLEHRMLPAGIFDQADHCHSAAGEQAIRRFIAQFDPGLAAAVKIEVVRSRSFVLTSLPDHRLLISEAAVRGTSPDGLAAMIAHEISHLKHDDAVEAVFRARGPVETYSRIIFGPQGEVQGSLLRFHSNHEERADKEALGMLVAAGISPSGGADLYLELDSADALSKGFGPELAALHPGPSWRGFDWAAAAKANPGRPAFSRQEAGAIASFCPARREMESIKSAGAVNFPSRLFASFPMDILG